MADIIFDEKVFNEKVGKTVIKSLTRVFGSGTVQAINFYLRRSDTDLMHVCYEPEKISEVLHKMLGKGAGIIEREIIKSAYEEFGLVLDITTRDLKVALERLEDSVRDSQD